MNSAAPVAFATTSMLRRVHSENVVLLGGGRALLLQVANPAVAAAVAEHSSFRLRKTGRLLRTLRSTLAIAFGDSGQVTAAASSINAIHARVASDTYSALDPDLLFWVLATLIDTALVMHKRFLRPLSEADAQEYYDDMLTAGGLLGVRRDRVPATIAGFHSYFDGQIDQLTVTPEAREIAADLFASRLLLRPFVAGLRSLTGWLLPRRLQAQYGISVSWPEARLFDASAELGRLFLPHLPPQLRAPPAFLLPAGAQAAASKSATSDRDRLISASHQGHLGPKRR